jgi:hypothetical protein
VGWLKTDSVLSSLGDDARRGFLNDIGHLIDDNYHGIILRNFVCEIITAWKAAAI